MGGTTTPLPQANAHAMIRRHTSSGGTLKNAMANHTSTRTT
jgi:hypothetical protein